MSSERTDDSREAQIIAEEPRNALVLAAHQIGIRVAWVFKTESVIMPAFMDHISGAGWLRGCLPVMNRLGHSIPPLLLSERLKNMRHKKGMLFTSSILMALPFLVLSALWFSLDDKRQSWMPAVYLILYFLFFCAVGLSQLSYGTVQGKLIRADRRGRLMSLSGVVGAILSVAVLLLFLDDWLRLPDGGFGLIFGFCGAGFFLSALLVVGIAEPADDPEVTRSRVAERFGEAWQTFCHDRDFRQLAIVSMCFCPMILLFPHFQSLGRRGASIQDSATDLMVWVIAQNVAVGVYSFIAGLLADRFGNRIVLRYELLLSAATPLVALWLASGTAKSTTYWITFGLIGITPVTLRTMMNLNLELTDTINHPRYVSTLSVCAAIPFLASPLVGYGVDLLGFLPVFVLASVLILVGFGMTFRLPEPRSG